MGQELVAMNTGEFDHLEVIRRVAERSLTQTKAAELIGLSGRQVRGLGIAHAERGPPGWCPASADDRATGDCRRSSRASPSPIVRERYAVPALLL